MARRQAERIDLGGEMAVDSIRDYQLVNSVLEQLGGLVRLARRYSLAAGVKDAGWFEFGPLRRRQDIAVAVG